MRHAQWHRNFFMFRLLPKLIRNEEGQDLAEYGIALAILTLFIVVVMATMKGDLHTIWDNIVGLLNPVSGTPSLEI